MRRGHGIDVRNQPEVVGVIGGNERGTGKLGHGAKRLSDSALDRVRYSADHPGPSPFQRALDQVR